MGRLKQYLHDYIQNPLDPYINASLGEEYENIGQGAAALSYFLRAAELTYESDPEFAYCCILKTFLQLYRTKRRPDYEREQLQTAIAFLPSRPEAYFHLSIWHSSREEWKPAYMYACLGLEYIGKNSLTYNVEYPGDYMLLFQKAFSSWYIGQREESKKLFTELYYVDTLPHHKEIIKNNLINFGIEIDTPPNSWHEPLTYTFEDDHQFLKYKFTGASLIDKNYSQCYQDLFVLTALEGKRNGIYLEVGAGQPFYGNNTALLKEFGWQGSSFDVDESLIQMWREQRPDDFIINQDATRFDFSIPGVNHIDYLQLDIDPPANTFKVLENIPFDKIDFSVITYEHDYYVDETKSYRDKSRKILQEKGYVLIAGNISPDLNSPYEDWWVNPKYVSKTIINKMKNVNQEVLFAKDYMFKYLSQ
jgi:hypothetical protein